ncbi:Rz1-like lysis system protein LysC [Singulisphaera sp. PoT]|uniref:Rz1-like lysis system protein LysC n=1 Tax=Singulisphaera sp. PoT TaxID=3411797 RepID=UPI003BF4FBB0
MLSACSTTPSPQPIAPPADLTQPCEPISPLPMGLTMTGLAKRYLALIGQYNRCSMRHDALAEAVK